MMTELECPVCKTEFEAVVDWGESGSCPKCGNEWSPDEVCNEDYSDCWMIIEWDRYK
jgi:peptide subunit release factor 1 (eRF1)